MSEPEPRYVVTFRPGTPEMVLVGVATLLGAAFGAYVARVWRWVDCSNEAWSECSTPGLIQLVIAYVGVLPAVVTLVQSIRGRGHPWRWFLATAIVYAIWGLYVFDQFSG